MIQTTKNQKKEELANKQVTVFNHQHILFNSQV